MMLDDITWKCEICKAVRPDDAISEATGLPYGTCQRNIKFCNDKPQCYTGAAKKGEEEQKIEAEEQKPMRPPCPVCYLEPLSNLFCIHCGRTLTKRTLGPTAWFFGCGLLILAAIGAYTKDKQAGDNESTLLLVTSICVCSFIMLYEGRYLFLTRNRPRIKDLPFFPENESDQGD